MKREQNHVKKISIIHLNNRTNNPELNIYPSKKSNILNTPEIINNYIKNTSFNTINDAKRISRRIYRPKLSSDENDGKIERVKTDILDQNNIYKREINLNRNQCDKIELSRNSNNHFLSYNCSVSNSFEKKNDVYKNNSSLHIINQSKKNKETDNKNIDKNIKNNTTIFISGLSKHNKVKSDLNKNIPNFDIMKSKTIIKDYNPPKKGQTPRISLIKNKFRQKNDLNIGKEENKVKFSRRLEITEKTEVLLPNQIFKPFEQYEKKENPIIEIKKNKEGKNIRTIKEIVIKTTIENSIINAPNTYIVKNSSLPKVTLIKKKTTKEYITKIKFYSNSIDLNKNNNIINEIKNEKQIMNEIKTKNHRPSNSNIKNEVNIITNEKEPNNEPKIESGKNIIEKNNYLKINTNERNKRNIKNTVYSNLINNNINKSHKRNNSNKASNINKSKINNIIRRNIQNNNYNTINNENRKRNLNIDNGINNEKENIPNKFNKNSSNTKENTSNNKNTNKLLTVKDFNYFQGIGNESQLLSEIVNLNGSMNGLTVSDGKLSSELIFDTPINLDFDKKEIMDKNDEEKKEIIKEKANIIEEKIIKKKNKYQKLNEFINEFNDDAKKDNYNLNNNAPKGDKNSSVEIKSPIIDSNKNDEKILNQMQISNINLSLKECEENENDDLNNASNGENTNNIDNKNLTGSIMFINSNIDKNIHIQNGLENYSINMDANNSTDNFNIIECENISRNNEKDFINKLESIKNKINNKHKSEIDNEQEIIENNDIDEKDLENEYDVGNEEKFFNPLTNYENKFNLDQINPF